MPPIIRGCPASPAPASSAAQPSSRSSNSAYARAETGELALVLLSGEAGIGKTRLVREHAARVRALGGLVLVGESIQLGDMSLPYGPFLDALGPGARARPPE